MYSLVCLLALLGSLSMGSAMLTTGQCAQSPILDSFDAQRYSGKWYEIERFPVIYEAGLDCVTAEYEFFNSTSVKVKNSGIYLKSNKKPTSVNGFAYVPKASEPNRLLVEFPEVSRLFTVKGKYDVWSTDYDNYSLVYSCTNFLGIFKIESAWILARQKQLDQATTSRLKDLLKGKNVDPENFTKTQQVCDN